MEPGKGLLPAGVLGIGPRDLVEEDGLEHLERDPGHGRHHERGDQAPEVDPERGVRWNGVPDQKEAQEKERDENDQIFKENRG